MKQNGRVRVPSLKAAGYSWAATLTIAIAMMSSTDQVASAGGVVTNCTEVALRAVMVGGGTVTFACDGIITLTNTITNSFDTVLDGTGHQVTISGGYSVRVFCVSPNTSFKAVNLTIANARCNTGGAGLLNNGGTVDLSGVAFTGNLAAGAPAAQGGAIENNGTLALENCSFTYNSCDGVPSSPPGDGLGGAIYNTGTIEAYSCVFSNNSAVGAPGTGYTGIITPPGNGAGGAIYNLGITVLDGCTLSADRALGGDGSSPYAAGVSGGWGGGGAVYNLGQLTVRSTSFLSNSAQGGSGSTGQGSSTVAGYSGGDGGSGDGSALYNAGGCSVAGATFAWNGAVGGAGGHGSDGILVLDYGTPGGLGGAGSDARGVVFNRGSISLVNSTFAQNTASGGKGSGGGKGGDGKYAGRGGDGGAGGSASGFAWSTNSQVAVTNCTIALNTGQAGSGGAGGPGGQGLHPGSPGLAGSNGVAKGSFNSAGGQLLNTLLSSNVPANFSGTITDAGHNLSSDGSGAFTNSGSMNNTDPILAPLAYNGGPTLTMALLPGSPAIDAGDTTAAPPTDQRGFPRPAGSAADIGAFEYGSVMPSISISRTGASGLNILATGNTGRWCRLLSSTDLMSWVPVATNQIGGDGTVLMSATCSPATVCRFYRLAMP